MIDLHAYVPCGVRSVEDVELDSGDLVERRACMCSCAQPEMDLRSYLGKHIDSSLDVLDLILKDEIVVRSQRCRVESRDIDGLGTYFRVGHDAVGTLLDAWPQSAFQKGCDSLLRGDGLRFGKIEFGIDRFRIGLDSDLEKFSLLSSDNFRNSAAYRGRELDIGSFFIDKKDGSRLDGITFLYCEFGNKTFEIGWLDSDCLRNYTFEDLSGRYTFNGYIEPLFQFYIVNHNLLYKVNLAANIDKTFVDLRRKQKRLHNEFVGIE